MRVFVEDIVPKCLQVYLWERFQILVNLNREVRYTNEVEMGIQIKRNWNMGDIGAEVYTVCTFIDIKRK